MLFFNRRTLSPHVGGPALAVFVCCTLHTRGAYSTGALHSVPKSVVIAKCAPLHAKMTQHDFCTMVRRKVEEEKGGGNCNRSWDVCCSLFSHRKHFVANSFKSEERMQRLKLLTPTLHPKQKVEPRAIWPADLRVRSSSESWCCILCDRLVPGGQGNDFSKSSVFDDPTRPHTKNKRWIVAVLNNILSFGKLNDGWD